MSNWKIFGKGVGIVNKKGRMILYLWLMNFLFSLVMIAPIYFLLNKDFSRSLEGERLVRGFDMIWLGDVIYKYQDILPLLTGWIMIPALLYFLLNIFLAGGIIGRIQAGEEKADLSGFLGDCGKYFPRFLRVFLISLLGYFILFGLLFPIISSLFNLWTKNASTEWSHIFCSNLKFLIQILFFSMVRMFFDYVKISLVVEDSKKTLKATLSTFRFMGKKFFRAWILFLLVGIVSIILALVYWGVEKLLPQSGSALFLITFLWGQLYILSRMWTKVLLFATEYYFLILGTRNRFTER